MKIRRYNVHTLGNSLLIEFQGEPDIGELILTAIERIIAEGITNERPKPISEPIAEPDLQPTKKKEKRYSKRKLEQILLEAGQDKEKAAEIMGIDIKKLIRKLRHHGLEIPA